MGVAFFALASACAAPGVGVGDGGAPVEVDGAVRVGEPLAPFEPPVIEPRFRFERWEEPDRTVVTDGDGEWIATFTDGARTVTLAGPERTFVEATAVAVTHGVQVRVLGEPFAGVVDEVWLVEALAAAKDPGRPDVLALAAQYLAGGPAILVDGLQIGGDASYGPIDPVTGARIEGSDFNDYLGVPWIHPDGVDGNEAEQLGCLDCSGYVRMLFGYRLGLPMIAGADGAGSAIPRRAVQILASAPGVVTIADGGVQVVAFERLAPGDLVFFDADAGDGPDCDHVGIYLGVDAAGHHRFLSSRKGADGPTFGDVNGASRLDGTGLYATAFRAARRL